MKWGFVGPLFLIALIVTLPWWAGVLIYWHWRRGTRRR